MGGRVDLQAPGGDVVRIVAGARGRSRGSTTPYPARTFAGKRNPTTPAKRRPCSEARLTDIVTYFAYGSNMCPARLGARVPTAVFLGVAALRGHSLRWHKVGKDGSGKCDVFRTDRPDDQALGVLYSLPVAEKRALDRIEGVGHGYVDRPVEVTQLDGRPITALTYVAMPDSIDRGLLPFDWYREHVVCGARDRALPATYLDALEAQPCRVDPDSGRASKERAERTRGHDG